MYVILGNNLEYIITRCSINFCKGIQFVFAIPMLNPCWTSENPYMGFHWFTWVSIGYVLFSFFRPRTSQSELRAFDIIQKYWNALFFHLNCAYLLLPIKTWNLWVKLWKLNQKEDSTFFGPKQGQHTINLELWSKHVKAFLLFPGQVSKTSLNRKEWF